MARHRRKALIAVVIVVVGGVSCASQAPPVSTPPAPQHSIDQRTKARTSFRFLPTEKAQVIEDILEKAAVPGTLAKTYSAQEQGSSLAVLYNQYEYRLAHFEDYLDLHHTLVGLSPDLPLRLNSLSIESEYSSLDAKIGVIVTLYGQSTPNSTLLFRYGGLSWEVPVSASGAYQTELTLRKGYDYVFARVGEGSFAKHLKISVFTRSEEPSNEREWEQAK